MKKYIGKVARMVGFFGGLIAILWFTSDYFEVESAIYNVVLVDEKENEIKNEEPHTIDVIFAGDSECYAAFSPIQMWKENGFTSFLCATSAQRLCDTYYLLEKTFETQSPKVVVLNTNCMYRSASDVKKNDDEYIKALGEYIPIFRYHARWKSLVKDKLLKEYEVVNYTKSQKLKGFRVRDAVVPYEGGDYMIETDKVKSLAPDAVEYMDKIKALCEENGSELMLVSIPSAKNWTYEKHNGVAIWAGENNINYIDMNLMTEELDINWELDTKDAGDHLNFEGAKKISAYFGQYLDETYDLPDHREDKKYESWHQYEELLE